MRRNEGAVPKLAPPVIATASAMNGHNGSITMVKKEILTPVTNTKQKSSRRKCLQPIRRMTDATLFTTSLPHQQPSSSPNLFQIIKTTTQAPPNLTTAAAQNVALASFLASIAINNNSLTSSNGNSNNLALWLIKNYGSGTKYDS